MGNNPTVDAQGLLDFILHQPLVGVIIHRDFKPLFVNSLYLQMFGYKDNEPFDSLLEIIPAELHAQARLNYKAVIAGQAIPEIHVYENSSKDGRVFWVELYEQRIQYQGDWAAIMFIKEITQELVRTRQLVEAKQQIQTLFDETLALMPLGISVYSHDMKILAWNDEYCQLSGVDPSALYVGMDLQEKLNLENAARRKESLPTVTAEEIKAYWQDREESVRQDPFPNGRVVESRGRKLADGRYIFCYFDRTDQARQVEQLKMWSEQDALTGVLNRRSFIAKSSAAIKQHQQQALPLSALLIDLDFFKSINDRFGHLAGDAVLVDFVQLCQRCLRQQDSIGRLGGEEFCILLPNCDISTAIIIARRILNYLLGHDLLWQAHTIHYSASIGASQLRSEDQNFNVLFQRIDDALFQAKDNGRAQLKVAD